MDDLEAHLLRGVVISTPALFVMGRPVPRGAEVEDAWRQWPAGECDAWYVWVAVGGLRAAVEAMPWSLPWVGWYRQSRGWTKVRWRQSREILRLARKN